MTTEPQEKTALKPMTEGRKAEIAELFIRAAAKEDGPDAPTYAELSLALIRATAKGFLLNGGREEDRETDVRDCSETLGISSAEALEFLNDVASWGPEEG
jgi:hypothetical protein